MPDLTQHIKELCQQASLSLIAAGNLNPTEEDLKAAFLARIEAENAICNRYLSDKKFAAIVLHGLSIEVYHDARKRGELERWAQSMRDADRNQEIRSAANALNDRYFSNI